MNLTRAAVQKKKEKKTEGGLEYALFVEQRRQEVQSTTK